MTPPRHVSDRLRADGSLMPSGARVAPRPFALRARQMELIEKLGLALHRFNTACNLLYRQSAAGKAHAWVAPLLDAGKPPELVALSRHEKLKGQLPAILCPRLLLTENGFALMHLDPLPRDLGLTAWLSETYAELGEEVVGGAKGVREGFASVLKDGEVLISATYAGERAQLEWLAGADRMRSVDDFTPGERPLMRFFASAEYANLAKFKDAWRPEAQLLTPPLKPYLEEKLWLALFWSRPLQEFWRQEIGEKGQRLLQSVIPYSWVLDPTPLPIHAAIPELNIASWDDMSRFTPDQRNLVLSTSAPWPATADYLGSDLSSEAWMKHIRAGLAEFATSPRLLRRFVAGATFQQEYLGDNEEVASMTGHAQVFPCYFVVNDRVTLGGALVKVREARGGDLLQPGEIISPATVNG